MQNQIILWDIKTGNFKAHKRSLITRVRTVE